MMTAAAPVRSMRPATLRSTPARPRVRAACGSRASAAAVTSSTGCVAVEPDDPLALLAAAADRRAGTARAICALLLVVLEQLRRAAPRRRAAARPTSDVHLDEQGQVRRHGACALISSTQRHRQRDALVRQRREHVAIAEHHLARARARAAPAPARWSVRSAANSSASVSGASGPAPSGQHQPPGQRLPEERPDRPVRGLAGGEHACGPRRAARRRAAPPGWWCRRRRAPRAR